LAARVSDYQGGCYMAWKTAQPFPLGALAARDALTPALSRRERGLSEGVFGFGS